MASTIAIEVQTLRRRTAGVRASANLLSASRVVLGAMWLWAFVRNDRRCIVLGTIALCAALTDLVDGPLARRVGSASPLGRWLDSFADVAFVLTALSCEAAVGAVPAYIPILIATSFAQYVIDSILISGVEAPVSSRLGHWGGVLNYVLVIVLTSQFKWLVLAVHACAPAFAIFYLSAIIERTFGYDAIWRRVRRPSPVRDSPAEGTPVRSARCKT